MTQAAGLLIGLLLCFLTLVFPAQAQDDSTQIPWGIGFPIEVQTSSYFNSLSEISDADESFTAKVDLRFRWKDLRHAYDTRKIPQDRMVFPDAEVANKFKEMWHPAVQVLNIVDTPLAEEQLLYIYPNGQIEWFYRLHAKFKSPLDVMNFPFDQQKLPIELGLKENNDQLVVLTYDQDDLNYAGLSSQINLTTWDFGMVDLMPGTVTGLDTSAYSNLRITLSAQRRPWEYFWPVFVPIFAVMIVPVLAIWLNKFAEGAFQIEAFELVNMIVGGLFAIIALNFTINSAFPSLASGDNTIVRLFGLNYLLIAIALLINIVVFKSEFVFNWLGKYRIQALYQFLCWGIPVLTLTLATAIILVAVA